MSDHEYSTTHIELPSDIAGRIKSIADSIPDDDLAEDGREKNPHITVKYGLTSDSPKDVEDATNGVGGVDFELGNLGVFPADEQRDSDVLFVSVDSQDLKNLNKKIADSVPHVDTHKEYNPHATVAYLKRGVGSKYAGRSDLSGIKGKTNQIVHSSKDGTETKINLGEPIKMAKLTSEERDALPDSDFALPGRRYPIPDQDHARNALARAAGKPEEAEVRAAVHKRYPDIGKDEPKKMSVHKCMYLVYQGASMSAADDTPTEVAGFPCEYFWKDLIATGDYEHPTKHFTLDVDSQKMSKWAKTGEEMLASGVAIPINCDHSDSARDVVGYVKKFKVVADKLMGLCQFIGKDASLLAARNLVSIGVDPDFTDGKKRNWGEAIVHLALTPVPVAPNQSEFVKAASRISTEGDVLLFSTVESSHRSNPMADNMMPCSTACMSRLEKRVGGLSAKPMEDKAEHVAGHVEAIHDGLKKMCNMSEDDPMMAMSLIEKKLKEQVAPAKNMSSVTAQKARRLLSLSPDVAESDLPETIADKAMSLAADLTAKATEVAALNEQVKSKDAQILELSAVAPKKPEAALMSQYSENWKLRRDHIVGTGIVSEQDMVGLEKIFADRTGSMTPMALSTCSTGDPYIFAVSKWLLSLAGTGVKFNAGTTRDGNFQIVNQDRPGGLTSERMKELGLSADDLPRRKVAAK